MTTAASDAVTPDLVAPQYGRGRLFLSLRSVVEATIRAAIFARRCEHHFDRHGRISPEAMTQIAERTRLFSAG